MYVLESVQNSYQIKPSCQGTGGESGPEAFQLGCSSEGISNVDFDVLVPMQYAREITRIKRNRKISFQNVLINFQGQYLNLRNRYLNAKEHF